MYDLNELKNYVEEKLKISIRTTALGFVQRGGNPSAFDRILASRMGVASVELLLKGSTGCALGIKKNEIISVDFTEIEKIISNKDEDYKLLKLYLGEN